MRNIINKFYCFLLGTATLLYPRCKIEIKQTPILNIQQAPILLLNETNSSGNDAQSLSLSRQFFGGTRHEQ